MTDSTPGWQPDPTGRHEHRYWDGSQWSDHVADGGVSSTDAYAGAAEAAGGAGPDDGGPEPVATDAGGADQEPVEPGPTDPTTESPGWGDPTTAGPAVSDPTATWPATPAPPPPPVPPVPQYGAPGPIGPEPSGSKRGLLVGGGILAAVLLAVLAFMALGGGDDDDASDVEARLASQIKSESDGELTDAQADCVARHIVDEIGEDDLKDVDFDADEPPPGLEDEFVEAAFGAISECDIDPTALSGGSSDGDSDDGGSGEDGSYGSDPELDALYDDCEGGDYEACDQLFLDSPSDSEYEEFGDTCGGRNEPSGYCVDLYEGEGSSSTDGDIDLDANMQDTLAGIYEETLGLEREKAECLAEKLAGLVESGELSEDQAMSDFFDYLSDCDISMDEISSN